MKKLFLLPLFFSCFFSYGQTKKETIDWLNSKFEYSPIVVSEIEKYTMEFRISQDGSFSIQYYNYSPKVFLPDTDNYRRKVMFTGHFKDLSPNSIRTSKKDGKIFFYASCTNSRCITQQNQGPNDFSVYYAREVELAVTSDVGLEERCKKAFQHLIKLCGGKNEVF